jgi:hypothetical protein
MYEVNMNDKVQNLMTAVERKIDMLIGVQI